MKLFNPSHADHFVFATCPKGYKEGTAPKYAPVKAVDVETAERQLFSERLINVYSYQVGRYDQQGRFMTFQPPVEGIRPGKYIVHPLAQQEYETYRSF